MYLRPYSYTHTLCLLGFVLDSRLGKCSITGFIVSFTTFPKVLTPQYGVSTSTGRTSEDRVDPENKRQEDVDLCSNKSRGVGPNHRTDPRLLVFPVRTRERKWVRSSTHSVHKHKNRCVSLTTYCLLTPPPHLCERFNCIVSVNKPRLRVPISVGPSRGTRSFPFSLLPDCHPNGHGVLTSVGFQKIPIVSFYRKGPPVDRTRTSGPVTYTTRSH